MAIPETPSGREDFFLAAAAGQNVSLPEPASKKEHYLSAIVQRFDEVLSQLADVRAISDAMPELNLAVHVVETLPEQGEENAIYLVPSDNSITHARFAKYIWIDGAWEALSVAETIMSVMDAWDRKMYWTLYGRLSGNLLIYQGRALDKVTTDMAYAGTAAQLTTLTLTRLYNPKRMKVAGNCERRWFCEVLHKNSEDMLQPRIKSGIM